MRVKGLCTSVILDADTESAQPFGWIDGTPRPVALAEYNIAATGLTWARHALRPLLTGLAEALAVIHASGIVHTRLQASTSILTDSRAEGHRLLHRPGLERHVLTRGRD